VDLYKLSVLIIRLFGVVCFIVGTTLVIGTILGFYIFGKLEGVWYLLLQYFVYGTLEMLAGLALLALARPIAKLVTPKS
jgi:hypothetical protein